MGKSFTDKKRVEEDIGIVEEGPVDETDLEEQEVVLWEELMQK